MHIHIYIYIYIHNYTYVCFALREASWRSGRSRARGRGAPSLFFGCCVQVVVAEVVIVRLGKISHEEAKHSYNISAKERCGYNHPGYDHLYVLLTLPSSWKITSRGQVARPTAAVAAVCCAGFQPNVAAIIVSTTVNN